MSKIDISVVSGTWNRLHLLKNMVNSARQSFNGIYGLNYEFVIVDGGSSDGTIEWCKKQSDIHLIEHGRLMGAVKSFNDGAYAANGTYVILGNDDIKFLENSILYAYNYMQKNPLCGIGCFYQDRNGHDWHIEYMPVIEDGEQKSKPYGQVCIVLKWLGDRVGWWGTPAKSLIKDERNPGELYTYGGDNELSSNVYEFGYKISPVPNAKIHDLEPKDGLRSINNIGGKKDPRAMRGHHPDSWSWGQKWRRVIDGKGLVGPIVASEPKERNPINVKERILYLPIYETGWPIQKKQKYGLRQALSKIGAVIEIDYVGINEAKGKEYLLQHIREECLRLEPTILLSQLHNGGIINPSDIDGMRNYFFGIWINWNGDFWPENLVSSEGLELARKFDLQTTVNREAVNIYRNNDINAEYWQIGWEPEGVGHQPNVNYDVCFLGNCYSEERRRFVANIRSLQGLNLGIYGQGWPKGWSAGQNLYDFVSACKIYRGSKISLGDSQWPDSGFVSNRVMQALAAGGSALAHQWFKDMELLGLVDGKTVIVWNTFDELKDKIKYYLGHENERRQIAEAGERLALENHSFDNRVMELMTMLGRHKTEQVDWRF